MIRPFLWDWKACAIEIFAGTVHRDPFPGVSEEILEEGLEGLVSVGNIGYVKVLREEQHRIEIGGQIDHPPRAGNRAVCNEDGP